MSISSGKLATVIAGGLLVAATPLYFGYWKPLKDEETYRLHRAQSMMNLLDLSMAITKYKKEKGVYPAADSWMDQLRPYISKDRPNPFANPYINGGNTVAPGWAYNILLDKLKDDPDVEKHGGFFLVSRRNAGTNATFRPGQSMDGRVYKGRERTLTMSIYLRPYPCYMENGFGYKDNTL